MKTLAVVLVFFSAVVAHATPSATITSFAQDAVDGKRMKVVFSLSEKAVVTAEMLSRAEAGGTKVPGFFDGDVNRLLESGEHVLYWRPDESVAGSYGVGCLMVDLAAYAPDDPPLYMAVFLPDSSKPAFYYASVEDIPGGPTNGIYKSDYLLMRRIPAAGRESRGVTLPADFYFGVYELTLAQHMLMLNTPSTVTLAANDFGGPYSHCDACPAPNCFSTLRGVAFSPAAREEPFPDGKYITQYRARYGIEFDLPSEAEWEYAARAGETGGLWTGMTAGEVAWYRDNSGCETWKVGEKTCTHSYRPVGQKKPNPWGLYDILGNLGEWCLDGSETDKTHVIRGGSCGTAVESLSLAYRVTWWGAGWWALALEGDEYGTTQIGCRLYAPAKAVK